MFKLKEIREECGLKRSELARELGINAGTIANYEKEKRQAPYEYLMIFAEYFDVSIDYLLGRKEDEKPMIDISKTLSIEERQLLEKFRKLDKTAKSRIIEYVGLWKDEN